MTTAPRNLKSRAHGWTNDVTKVKPRQDHGRTTSGPAIGDVQARACELAIRLAETAGARALERAAKSPETTKARRLADRRARHATRRLEAVIGPVPTAALVSALTVDGGLALRAAAEAAPELREHATWALVSAASIAVQRGVRDTASLTMLARAAVWGALEATLQARALREGAPSDVLKLAALCNAQHRLTMLTSDHLARHGGQPIVQPEPEADGRRMLADYYAELDAREDEREGSPPMDAPLTPGGMTGAHELPRE